VQAVQALAQACEHVVVQNVSERLLPNGQVAHTAVQRHQTLPPLPPAPAYSAAFDRQWAISSYSALVRDAAWGTAAAAAGPLPARVLREDEPDDAATELVGPRPAAQPWHRFPRGAFAGNFLHDQLEWLAAQGFALDTSTHLQQALQGRCERQGWGHRADDVLAWLRLVCSTPLPALGTALCGLAASTPEMEFWFPSDGLNATRIDSLCRQHLLPGRPRPVLPERTLKGLLMGFADLVFEHEGRFWVLDYKSNALGARDADYTPAAMEAAMLEHRYDVQAVLYLLALHRLLKSRLGAGYRPAQQLGGAVYLFLRGVRSASAGCWPVAPPLALLDTLDELLQPARSEGLW
jgi:exodeoxyribonuclease V beta subunit